MAGGRKSKVQDLDVLLNYIGFLFELLSVFVKALKKRNGTVEHLRRLLKEPELVNQVFDLIVVPMAQVTVAPVTQAVEAIYKVMVDYVLPSPEAIKKTFDWVSDLYDGRPWENHESCKGVDETPGIREFLLKHFGKAMTSEHVLAWAEANGYRAATLKEILAFVAAHPDLQRQFWIVALGSSALRDGGRQCVPLLSSDGDGRRLFGNWFGRRWNAGDRFLLVRK